jgi:hypothetical protein
VLVLANHAAMRKKYRRAIENVYLLSLYKLKPIERIVIHDAKDLTHSSCFTSRSSCT